MKLTTRLSPNCGDRPAGTVIDTIVLHGDAHPDPSPAGEDDVVRYLTTKHADPRENKSYHVYVRRSGAEAFLLVPAKRRAWHAGVSRFLGRDDVNDFALGLCLANTQRGEAYPVAQLRLAAAIAAGWMREFPAITLERITTHAIIAPTRRSDPTPPFSLPAFRQLVAQEFAR